MTRFYDLEVDQGGLQRRPPTLIVKLEFFKLKMRIKWLQILSLKYYRKSYSVLSKFGSLQRETLDSRNFRVESHSSRV